MELQAFLGISRRPFIWRLNGKSIEIEIRNEFFNKLVVINAYILTKWVASNQILGGADS